MTQPHTRMQVTLEAFEAKYDDDDAGGLTVALTGMLSAVRNQVSSIVSSIASTISRSSGGGSSFARLKDVDITSCKLDSLPSGIDALEDVEGEVVSSFNVTHARHAMTFSLRDTIAEPKSDASLPAARAQGLDGSEETHPTANAQPQPASSGSTHALFIAAGQTLSATAHAAARQPPRALDPRAAPFGAGVVSSEHPQSTTWARSDGPRQQVQTHKLGMLVTGTDMVPSGRAEDDAGGPLAGEQVLAPREGQTPRDHTEQEFQPVQPAVKNESEGRRYLQDLDRSGSMALRPEDDFHRRQMMRNGAIMIEGA